MSEKEVNEAIAEIVEDNTTKNYSSASTKQLPQVQSGVKERKKSFGKKFAETFLSDDIDSVGEWVKRDVIIPGLKNLFYDTATNALQGILWNTFGGSPRDYRRDDRRYQRDYTGYSTNKSRNNRVVDDRPDRDRFDFRDIVFVPEYDKGQTLKDAKRAADEVLFELTYLVDNYGHATVADYYAQIPGITSVYTDSYWGWNQDNFKGVDVKAVRGGYVITLPRPIYKPKER